MTQGALPAWSPLRRPAFRALWIAQLASNTGTWAQTVGAQWLMGDLSGNALNVALVQTATTLPVFLLVVPSGALGDVLDRRRLLLTGQSLMLAGAAALVFLTATDWITPHLLLAAIVAMGVGQALTAPSFQAVQPELVSRDELPQAALLNGASMNLARATGPALGGLLIAGFGPEATFALNALSFLGVMLVLYRWKRPVDHRPLGAEHMISAMRAGLRYIGGAPRFATVLARSALFTAFAAGLWALLPEIARGPLQLGARGYGLLLGGVGIGAVIGATVLPRLRARFGTNRVVTTATVVYAVAMIVTGTATNVPVVIVALMFMGAAWIAVQSTLIATAQTLLPAWTRARALAYFQLVFMGGQALAAFGWGVVAHSIGLSVAFVVPAVGLFVIGAVTWKFLRLSETRFDLTATEHLSELTTRTEPDSDAGPVLVTVEWTVSAENVDEFLDAMERLRRSRKRTGATMWGLYQDADDPALFLETFTVATWHEHLRQHFERGTVRDRELVAQARALTAEGAAVRVRHLLWAETSRRR